MRRLNDDFEDEAGKDTCYDGNSLHKLVAAGTYINSGFDPGDRASGPNRDDEEGSHCYF